jgi:flagellar hook assembly protein FlgD
MKTAFAILAALLAAPGAALAGGPTMTVRDVPLHPGRTLVSEQPPFDMAAVHWRGTGAVYLRARSAEGRWSAWSRADDDGVVQRGWHLGNLDWTGASTAIRFRTTGQVQRLRAYTVQSPVEPMTSRRLQVAGSPPIISRFGWQADESIRRHAPRYADGIHFAVVHHTAGSNSYTREQSAAIVRGIEIYHVEGNGWDDIGYNFLVDRYGQVFEGRYGGVDRPVIGAHSGGFNVGSVGVAVIGSYGSSRIAAPAKAALEQLLAWRLDLAHVNPLSTLTRLSGGNARFPAGVPVFLRAVAGHRDTGFTDCPGDALYAELPQIARDVAAFGGPKIWSPSVQEKGEGQVRFTARLSVAQPWTVTVTDSSGAQVAQGAGTGAAVDWTWDGSVAPAARYMWTIASPDARSASGSIGSVAVIAVQKAAVAPAQVAPGETATVMYTTSAAATVTAALVAPGNQTVATLLTASKPAGPQTLAFAAPGGLPNGGYTVVISAATGGKTSVAAVPLVVDDVLTGFAARGMTVGFTLTRAPTSIAFQVLRGANVVATPAVPLPVAGPALLTWDGTLTDGAPAPDGVYTLALTVADEATAFTRTATVTIDTTAPTIVPLSPRTLRFRVSEPVTLVLTVGAARYTRVLKQAAVTQFWLRKKPASFTLTATDAAGNASTYRYGG